MARQHILKDIAHKGLDPRKELKVVKGRVVYKNDPLEKVEEKASVVEEIKVESLQDETEATPEKLVEEVSVIKEDLEKILEEPTDEKEEVLLDLDDEKEEEPKSKSSSRRLSRRRSK